MPTKKLTGSGGPGRGQGRKPSLPEEALRVYTMRFTEGDRAEIETQGGIAWLRDVIKKARSARLRMEAAAATPVRKKP